MPRSIQQERMCERRYRQIKRGHWDHKGPHHHCEAGKGRNTGRRGRNTTVRQTHARSTGRRGRITT
eukprot:8592325-Pyramimonas_sp.AAC.1